MPEKGGFIMSVTSLKTGETMKQTSAGDKEKALDAALAQIERAFGKGSVMKLSGDYNSMEVDSIYRFSGAGYSTGNWRLALWPGC
jgi:hypothetical protein